MKMGVLTYPTDYSISAVSLARALEERNFESLWVVEHTHIPASRKTPHPFEPELPSIYWEAYEPFTFLAQVAAVTDTLKVATGVCLVPAHHPITLAKRAASLDSLSNGRFLFGAGGGWNAEELEDHGVEFKQRWQVFKENILAIKACWTEKNAEFHGKYVDFDAAWVEPKPVTKPHPPVIIGANSKWAIERVVDYAEGWLPWLPYDGAELDESLAQLNTLCDSRGRNRAEIEVSLVSPTIPENIEALVKLEAKGVERIIFLLPTLPESETLDFLDSVAQLIN
jgi:probable F420-dependent oxidoreductase